MPRIFRYGLILTVIVVLLGTGAIFGRYPSTGIREGTVMISVSRSANEPPVFSLTEEDDLRDAIDSAGTIWNQFGYNSLDGTERYLLTLTSRDGQITSFWITPTEWSDHGKTPTGFFEMLRQRDTEQDAP